MKPKKSLSQNFLIDKNVARKIISQTSVKNKIVQKSAWFGIFNDYIIENNPKKIILIEKDNNYQTN